MNVFVHENKKSHWNHKSFQQRSINLQQAQKSHKLVLKYKMKNTEKQLVCLCRWNIRASEQHITFRQNRKKNKKTNKKNVKMWRIDWTWRMNTEYRWQNVCLWSRRGDFDGADSSASTMTSVSLRMNQAQPNCWHTVWIPTIYLPISHETEALSGEQSAESNPWKASSSKEGAMARRIIRWLQRGTAGAIQTFICFKS